ncbi:hypothetical protein ACFL96_03310 [Thermoproteota archaeon]
MKIDDVIEQLDLGELIKVRKDLQKGGGKICGIVDSKIKKELRKHSSYCCVCNSKVDPYSVSNFTLVFGPEDMKKKATFCAIDCLEYFIGNLKDFWSAESQAFIKRSKQKD